MLIGSEGDPFDNPDWIYELKLDGERCIAYLDPTAGSELINKRDEKMLPKMPELARLHEFVEKKCILDGELSVIKDGKPDFFEIQRRSLMSNPLKIDLASRQYPACYTAFDILYYENEEITQKSLLERKKILESVIKSENATFALSRFIEKQGTAFFELAKNQDLEGIVAKHKNSRYYPGKRTKDWIKIKNMKDDDFVVCGYIIKEKHIISLVLGQYENGKLSYKGHVTTGVGGESFKTVEAQSRLDNCPFDRPVPAGNERAVWLTPNLVCTVKYMMETRQGGLRQPVLKGLRNDKNPTECTPGNYELKPEKGR